MTVDGTTILKRRYAAGDADTAEAEDRRTGGVVVSAPVSPVFGKMRSIVYARPRSAEHGIVAYSPARKTFELRLGALAPDALLLSSLDSRMVPLDGDEPDPSPFGHDKPSNSLFIPPEYRSVNCEICTAAVIAVRLKVKPAGVQCATTYTAKVDGLCRLALEQDNSPVAPFGIPMRWRHKTNFGDRTSRTKRTWDNVAVMRSATWVTSRQSSYCERTQSMLNLHVHAAVLLLMVHGGSAYASDAGHTRWQVEFLGEAAFQQGEYADGRNWEFRATSVETGEVKLFKSGTELGWFLGVSSYGDVALIDADAGSGRHGFTIYDLRSERKVVEFYVAFPHLSPDGRYLIYRNIAYRQLPVVPSGIKIIDLSQDFSQFEVPAGAQFGGIGEQFFPLAPPDDRPNLADAYERLDIGTGHPFRGHPLEKVLWNLEIGVLYFLAQDRTGHLNLIVTTLVPAPRVACTVPLLTARSLRGEHFARQSAVEREGMSFSSPDTLVVPLSYGPAVSGVVSDHRINLISACRVQSPDFVSRLRQGR